MEKFQCTKHMFIIVSMKRFYTEETIQLQGYVWEGDRKEPNHPLFKANLFLRIR